MKSKYLVLFGFVAIQGFSLVVTDKLNIDRNVQANRVS